MSRPAPRASVTFGRIQAISAGNSALNTCQKAMLSVEKDCSYENSNSHSLTAPPACQFQNSVLPYSSRFTPTQLTYRSQRISPHHNYGACTTQHTPPTPLYAHPPHPNPPTSYSPRFTAAQRTYRSQRISPHLIYGAYTPHPPHPPHPTHNHPTPIYRAPPLTHPTHLTPPTPTLP